jgi:hypothetical protein
MSSPPTLTGVEDPMLVCGAMASRSAAWLIQTPAECRMPSGEQTITGTFEASSAS